jgi:hypothetical protein
VKYRFLSQMRIFKNNSNGKHLLLKIAISKSTVNGQDPG